MWALQVDHFAARSGKIHVIRGENGSGKSTLIGVLAGLIPATTGTVTGVNGLRDRRAIALTPQTFNPSHRVPMTVQQFVATGRWHSRPRWRLASKTDRELIAGSLEEFAMTDLADRQLTELSGGQRLRMLLARTATMQAQLILLDEPTSALDERSSATVQRFLESQASRGAAVVVATHDHQLITGDHTLTLTVPACNPARGATQRVQE